MPFQIPHAPSVFHSVESAASTEEEDLRSKVCGDCVLLGGVCGVWTRGIPSGLGEVRRRRPRDDRDGVWARGADDVK